MDWFEMKKKPNSNRQQQKIIQEEPLSADKDREEGNILNSFRDSLKLEDVAW